MQRRISATLAVALVTSPLAFAATHAPASADGGAARAAGTQTLLNASFDKLGAGRVSASEFRSTLGGTNSSETAYDDSSVVARGSGKAYRLTLEKNTFKGSPGNNGVNIFVPLDRKVDNACISYDVKFDERFDWDMGGKLPGLGGVRQGVSPGTPTGGGNPGDKGWSGRMMWLSPESFSWAGPTDQMVSYMYGPRQKDYYGDTVRWGKSFAAGKWHKVRMCYRMNTVGKANGLLRAKLDGRRVLNITNHVYRTRNDVHISHLYWVVFRGGATDTWAGERDSYIDFDNVRVTTRV